MKGNGIVKPEIKVRVSEIFSPSLRKLIWNGSKCYHIYCAQLMNYSIPFANLLMFSFNLTQKHVFNKMIAVLKIYVNLDLKL